MSEQFSIPNVSYVVGSMGSGSVVLDVPSTAITTTTTSQDLVVGNFSELDVDVNITAVTGSTPTYVLSINRKGADGVYYPIYTGTNQAAPAKISLNIGEALTTNVSFGDVIQVVETVGGGTPSYTRSISIIGK